MFGLDVGGGIEEDDPFDLFVDVFHFYFVDKTTQDSALFFQGAVLEQVGGCAGLGGELCQAEAGAC